MPNVSEFIFDQRSGLGSFEFDNGGNTTLDLSKVIASNYSVFVNTLFTSGFVNSITADNTAAFQAAITASKGSIPLNNILSMDVPCDMLFPAIFSFWLVVS